MLGSEVPCTKPLKNTLPTGPKVQICDTQGGRRGFTLSDRYNGRKVLSCHADKDVAQRNADAAPKMFRKQNINIQFVLQCTSH